MYAPYNQNRNCSVHEICEALSEIPYTRRFNCDINEVDLSAILGNWKLRNFLKENTGIWNGQVTPNRAYKSGQHVIKVSFSTFTLVACSLEESMNKVNELQEFIFQKLKSKNLLNINVVSPQNKEDPPAAHIPDFLDIDMPIFEEDIPPDVLIASLRAEILSKDAKLLSNVEQLKLILNNKDVKIKSLQDKYRNKNKRKHTFSVTVGFHKVLYLCAISVLCLYILY